MKTFLLLLLLFLGSQITSAQIWWSWQNPLPKGNTHNAVSFTNTNTGTAVGAYGTILRTNDGEIPIELSSFMAIVRSVEAGFLFIWSSTPGSIRPYPFFQTVGHPLRFHSQSRPSQGRPDRLWNLCSNGLYRLAAILANHGHPEYWGDVERIVRIHLIESQVKDASWLRLDNSREDTEQFSRRDIDKRMIGGYAGWRSPTHSLFEGKEARCYYSEEGPGRLYQREHLLQDNPVTRSELFCDEGKLDFWKIK